MPSRKAYALTYTTAFKRQVKALEPKYHSLIREALQEQLQYEPEVRTRNRKPLKRPTAFNAEWELRFGPANRFRVFYRVLSEAVIILAIGEKERNRLLVDGEEVEYEESDPREGPGSTE